MKLRTPPAIGWSACGGNSASHRLVRLRRKLQAQIILALDVDNFEKAKYFVNKLYPRIKIFKVGLQLFTCCGPRVIKFLHQKGAGVFLDLKFFDIPNTVANAVRQAARQRVKMLTLHIAGGKEMLKAAVAAAKAEARRLKIKPPLLMGVTVLTSQKAAPQEVWKLAKEGITYGLDGIVCSAKEAGILRKKIKRKFIIITPGIRPEGSLPYDQKRTATAQEAVQAGSNFLVVGRPILEASGPLKAAKEMLCQKN